MASHLITGGSGFLGNLIAERLLASGEHVKVLDIVQDHNQSKEIEFIKADIRDEFTLNKAMKNVEVVHHNVALVPLTKSGKEFWSVNVNGSRTAAKVAANNGVRNFVHMSSSAIYGAPTELPITLNTKPHPIEIYGKGKLAGEIAVRNELSKSETNLVVIRPRTIIGPGRLGIFEILFRWIAENKNIYTIGNGTNKFQFVHAYDLMDAYMLAFNLNKPGSFNVGTEEYSTLRDALENLILFAGSNSNVKSIPTSLAIPALTLADFLRISPLAPWHYKTYHKPFFFDLTEIKELGWKSQYSNNMMLEESFASYLVNSGKSTNHSSPHRRALNEGILRFVKKNS